MTAETTAQPAFKVEKVPISKLTPDPKNARKHNADNIGHITASLRDFGQRKNVVITAEGVIIAGNGMVDAAKGLGWTHVYANRLPADWSYEQCVAFALADNRTAETSEWDSAILAEHMIDLDAAGWELQDYGFAALQPPTDPEQFNDDKVGPPPPIPFTKPGDIWVAGKHRIMCGDATSDKDMALLMAGELADCIWTDPPYNVNYEGGTDEALTIQNDSMSDEAFATFLDASYRAMYQVTKPGGGIYVAHSDTGGGVFRRAMLDAGWLLKQCLIWVKDSFVLSRQDYHWQHEPILYGWKPGAAHSWHGTRTHSTVIDDDVPFDAMKKDDLVDLLQAIVENSTVFREDKPRRNAVHPTMKPVRLIARMLDNSSKSGDLILDPFGGSGSTLVAAHQLGRRANLMELDPQYCDVILRRYQEGTDDLPYLEATGAVHDFTLEIRKDKTDG